VLGIAGLAAVALVYAFALSSFSEQRARALGFIALVVVNLSMILVSRSRTGSIAATLMRPNRAFWWIAGLAVCALILVTGLPAVAEAFRFETPGMAPALAAAFAGVAAVAAVGALRSTSQGRRGPGQQ
jgi:magnesium-transporting ATPase (P-type)